MKIAIGSDHAGFDLRHILADHLKQKGFEVIDYGCPEKISVDYPTYGRAVANAIKNGECEMGVLVCGTGCGISLAANRVPGIRAVNPTDALTAEMARRHNNANIISLGARVIGEDTAKMLVDVFFATEFEGGRHARRVDMIDSL